MKILFAVSALALVVMGAGCLNREPAAPATPTPVPVSTTPTTTTGASTLLVAPSSSLPVVVNTDWVTLALFDDWVIRYPSTATQLSLTTAEKTEGKLFKIDLGTAVQNPAGRSVPKRTLEISKLRPADYRIRDCDASLVGEQNISAVGRVVNTAAGTAFCLQSSSDAGAGNLYDTQDYIFTTDSGTYAFTFVTHSVQCANFPEPSKQCVAFDAGRDQALFAEIMGSIVKRSN